MSLNRPSQPVCNVELLMGLALRHSGYSTHISHNPPLGTQPMEQLVCFLPVPLLIQYSAKVPQNRVEGAQFLGSYTHTVGRLAGSYWLLISACCSTSCCNHLRSRSVDGKLCVCVPTYNFAFQIYIKDLKD